MILLEEKTELIISCFYKVYNKLGYGFLEKVYENSLLIELQHEGFRCFQQSPITVYYDQQEVGIYFCDILVDDQIILELKAGEGVIKPEYELQLMNYLRATDIEIGLVFHFGARPTFKRRIFTKSSKIV